MDWTRHYPQYYPAKEGEVQKKVEFADIGCGYGGLLIALATEFPDKLMLGKKEMSLTHVLATVTDVHFGRHGNPYQGGGLCV